MKQIALLEIVRVMKILKREEEVVEVVLINLNNRLSFQIYRLECADFVIKELREMRRSVIIVTQLSLNGAKGINK